MSNRTYLSIGDVLTLLRQEFPEVTISKIRFLESQGLVNPERSPSGYRKFYEHDVERLRWVLRQQSQNYLPLKVIRDRLSHEEMPTAARPGLRAIEDDDRAGASNGVADGPGERVAEPALAMSGTAPVGASGDGESRSPTADQAPASMPPARSAAHLSAVPSGDVTLAPATAGRAAAPAAESGRSRDRAVDGPRNAPERPGARPVVAAAPATGRGSADDPGSSARPAPGPPEPPPAVGRGSAPAAARPPAQEAVPTAAAGGRPPSKAGAPDPGAGFGAAPTGASFTAEELSVATGLAATDLAALEGFGLLQSVMVAGIRTYDEDALTVGRLAAECARFGLEPRHLRLYRNAADREAGLIEQIITPLLRQRNPEARQRAVDTATDLAQIGQGLRNALVQRELRRLFGH